MTSKILSKEKIDTLGLIAVSILCGVLLGGGVMINALSLQTIPELSKDLPSLLKIQKAADQAILYSYIGIGVILLCQFIPKRKKAEAKSESELKG